MTHFNTESKISPEKLKSHSCQNYKQRNQSKQASRRCTEGMQCLKLNSKTQSRYILQTVVSDCRGSDESNCNNVCERNIFSHFMYCTEANIVDQILR